MPRRVLVLAALLTTALLLSRAPLPATAQEPAARTFRDLGFGDQTARSMYGSVSYFFAVPPGRTPQSGSRMELVTSHSPLLVPDRSTMSVVVNGQSVVSAFLTPENRERARLSVPLPVEGFAGAGFFLQVRYYLRLTRDDCEQTQNPALWATVHADSRLTLDLRPSAEGPQLDQLAAGLLPAAPAAALSIGLPSPDRAPEELRAAGLVAFQYGRWAGAVGRDPLVEAATPAEDRAGVLVGAAGSIPPGSLPVGLRWDGSSLQATGGPVPAEYGAIGLTRPERPLLVVTGATPASVLAGAEALVQPERRSLLDGTTAVTTGAPVGWNFAGRPWRDGAASFAQLGAERREFGGPGFHSVQIPFERPPGWTLEAGGTLELLIDSTPAVRRETSWVAARVNGADAGTHRLDPQPGQPGRYTFQLPVEQLTANLDGQPQRRLLLEVQLYLDIPEADCTSAAPDAARATLLPASAWRLPHDEYRGLDLGRFPAMFFGEGRPPVTVVIPERAGPVELSAGLQVMAALGRWSGSDDATWPRLVAADRLTDEERRGHLVVLGGPETNGVAEAARREDRTLYRDTDPPLYQIAGDRAARWGTLQLVRSPWGRDRVLLVVYGNDTAGMRLAATSLGTAETLARIRGRTVTIADGLPPQTLAGADPAEQPPADLAPRVETSFRERLEPWQVVGAVLLGAFVASVALLLFFRLRRT